MTKVYKSAYILCFLSFFFVGVGYSQSNIEKGDFYFEKYSYKKAIKYYSLSLKKEENGAAMRKMATSYRLLKDYENAEIWYEKLMNQPARQPIDIYYYAEMLKSNGKYNDYLRWIRRYQKSAKDDSRVERALENQNYIKVLLEDKGLFEVSGDLPFNSKFSDICPVMYFDEEIVFSSNRYKLKLFGPKDNWIDGNFYDFYAVPTDSSGEFGSPIAYEIFNTKYHDVGITFSADGDEAYFGRTNYLDKELEKSSKGDLNLALFYSKEDEGVWGEEKRVSVDNKEFSTDHPSLSKDGNYLFFASDRTGGFGGLDIYYVKREGEGKWSKPVNLGSEINTEGNEVFPFIHETGNLYFSSDGLPGLGGLDIFEAKLDKDMSIIEIKNLGYPINEMKDDFGLVMDQEQKGGYFSSNRPGGMGDDDIYSFVYHKPKYDAYVIEGLVVKNESDTILSDVNVIVKDKFGVIIDSAVTDSEGYFKASAEVYGDYYFLSTKEGYYDNTERVLISRNNEKKNYSLRISLDSLPPRPDSAAIIVQKVADYESKIKEKLDTLGNLAQAKLGGLKLKSRDKKFIYDEERDVAVYLDSLGKLVDANEEHNYIDTVARYESYKTYNTEVTGEVEELNKVFFAKELVDTDKEALEKNKKAKEASKIAGTNAIDGSQELNTSFKNTDILRSIDGVVVVDDHTIIPPIFFNFNDDKVNRYSEKSLKKILKFMKKNEDVMLEIRSHTDCRGDDIYNVRLSERRAQSAAMYIINKGIFLGRIRAKGFGEESLINNCNCDGDVLQKVNCTEDHHRENRRSEFTFFKIDPVVSKESVLNEEE